LRIHALNVEEALASLKTVAGGLSTGEAARRLAEFGPNHLEEVEREPLLLRCAREFTHFFAIILWIGAGLAFIAELAVIVFILYALPATGCSAPRRLAAPAGCWPSPVQP
jgi:magnesium-transporting ATPase (P-type)